MITIYGIPQSRSTRALWALEECAQPYHFIALDFSKGQQLTSDYLALNPGAKVPVMVDGDITLTESGAIVNYIAKQYGNELIPDDTAVRAQYDRWAFFALTELEQPLWTMGKHRFALPAEHRIADIMATAGWEFQKALALFSQGLEDKPYILGDTFSAVDILLAHTLMWATAFKQDLPQQNIQDYLQRLITRDALKRVKEKEFAAKSG